MRRRAQPKRSCESNSWCTLDAWRRAKARAACLPPRVPSDCSACAGPRGGRRGRGAGVCRAGQGGKGVHACSMHGRRQAPSMHVRHATCRATYSSPRAAQHRSSVSWDRCRRRLHSSLRAAPESWGSARVQPCGVVRWFRPLARLFVCVVSPRPVRPSVRLRMGFPSCVPSRPVGPLGRPLPVCSRVSLDAPAASRVRCRSR